MNELSKSEQKVYDMVVLGFSNKQIAKIKCCTEKNIKFHVGNIFLKLKLNSRGQLIARHYLGEQRYNESRALSGCC